MSVDSACRAGSAKWNGPSTAQVLYQSYSANEDAERTNIHYERPPDFFCTITGGEWNVYSCNLWSGAKTDTASQEAKLDLLAELMDLRAGQRILDVGCGWGGPLAYLCQRYGVRGVGITLSHSQRAYAANRMARLGVDAQVFDCHWQVFEDQEGFDAIYSDEVIVHVNDLGGFFAKAHQLLRPGGRMVNKELHFTNRQHAVMGRGDVFVHEIYGLTGNYRTLAEELTLLDQHGFELRQVRHLPREHYLRTIDRWQSNMYEHRERLEALVGRDYYRQFRTYLKLAYRIACSNKMTLDIVAASTL